jgi:hypothetical protein
MVKDKYLTVRDLEKRKDLQFIDVDYEVDAIKEYFPKDDIDDFSAFFVKTKDGDYVEVWGIETTVPYLYERVYRVK